MTWLELPHDCNMGPALPGKPQDVDKPAWCSVGVIAGVPHPDPVLETEDGPSLCTEHPGGGGDQGYAVG